MKIIALVVALAIPLPALAQLLTEEVVLTGDDNEQFFGFSIVIGGELIVAATSTGSGDPGAAYVYRKLEVSGEWSQEQLLEASDGVAGDTFGAACAVEDDVIVVTAPNRTAPGSFPTPDGAAYVFRWNPSLESWEEEQILDSAGSFFGNSVAIAGERIIVGQRGAAFGGNAVVFDYDEISLEWIEVATLSGDDTVFGDQFGWRVDIEGDVAVVSARIVSSGSNIWSGSGTAYVFRRDEIEDDWVQEKQLDSDEDEDNFGVDVTLSGSTIAIGADRDDELADDSGKVYVYRWDDELLDWIEEATLTSPDGIEADYFGRSIALSDEDTLFIGADGADGVSVSTGAGYLYRRTTDGEWNLSYTVAASDGDLDDRFGFNSDFDEGVAVAQGRMEIGPDVVGAVYVFDPSLRPFLRGDCDGNGSVFALSDALFLLQWQFTDGPIPPCMDAADVDNDGTVLAILDALALLEWGFTGGDVPPDPGVMECGADPEHGSDGLVCEVKPETCD